MLRHFRRGALAVATLAPTLGAQAPDSTRRTVPLAAVTITATRTERSTFDTPQPITVLDSTTIREKLPHGVADLFRDAPGLDASGVGPNQRRPEIRGQRGQRILLLHDGLRLNNARRQQDFGELPALAPLSTLERVEVVRGPSSVLYGTDAIGGVVNLISSALPRGFGDNELRGAVTYRHGSAGESSMPDGHLAARFGRFGVRAHASYRDAKEYRAPSGTFGNVTLAEDELVRDSGVRDRSYGLALAYDLAATTELFARADYYTAERAGFGFIDPAKLGPNQPTIQILYPDQNYWRYTTGYRAKALSTLFANRAEVSAYVQRNKRHLDMNVFVPISPTANVTTNSFNFTDLETYGGRVELARSFGRHVLTYGVDAFRDNSENTDSSVTTTVGFGPPTTRTNTTPTVPNATFQSGGVFAQLELNPVERFTTIIGSRAQDITAETRETPGITRPLVKSSDHTAVWTANALYRLRSDLNAVASVGRGFRAPNLVERFFEGTAPEGSGFQRANPALEAETSINVDLGLRYRRDVLYGEAFVFRNDVRDAIKPVDTGERVNNRPAFQNQNVGRLRIDGLELITGARVLPSFDASVSWTRLQGKNISDPGSPIGDSYSSKIVGDLAYRLPSGRFSAGYTLRYQGEQKDVIVGTNPIGPVIPAFTVHGARASVRLFDRGNLSNRLSLTVDNIGDKLYAEFPNASFFRPEPRRSVSVALVTEF